MDLPFITVALETNVGMNKTRVCIDYGQRTGGYVLTAADDISDPEGNELKFQGFNDAVYYILSQGWEIIDWQYVKDGNVWIYRMKKAQE